MGPWVKVNIKEACPFLVHKRSSYYYALCLHYMYIIPELSYWNSPTWFRVIFNRNYLSPHPSCTHSIDCFFFSTTASCNILAQQKDWWNRLFSQFQSSLIVFSYILTSTCLASSHSVPGATIRCYCWIYMPFFNLFFWFLASSQEEEEGDGIKRCKCQVEWLISYS